MKNFFKSNVGTAGRLARAFTGLVFLNLAIGVFYMEWPPVFGWFFLFLGVWGLLAGLGGWCFARACGWRTRL